MFWVFNKFELMQAGNLMLKFWLFPKMFHANSDNHNLNFWK